MSGLAARSGGRLATPALDICRGATRVLGARGFASLSELALANGRRADIAAVSNNGAIWIVEVKSCVEDFRNDLKWPEYREYCDQLYFAVAPGFPSDVLPSDGGLIVADRYGGDIIRPAPEHRLPAPRRKAMTLRLARVAALRLQGAIDPEGNHQQWAEMA